MGTNDERTEQWAAMHVKPNDDDDDDDDNIDDDDDDDK